MKKHQLAAMVLSALSAGILISCSKPAQNSADEAVDNKAESTTAAVETSANKNTSNNPKLIDLTPENKEKYLTSVANHQIIPAYKTVAVQSQKLHSLATKLCQTDSNEPVTKLGKDQLNELRAQWLVLAKAWASAEIINFGPAMQSMSNLYINYFPDERGLVHQGVIELIDNNPNLTPEQLAQESAIVQGIPGLEEVLYANDSLNANQCQYIVSASEALSKRLDDVQNAWETKAPTLLSINSSEGNNTGMNLWLNSILALVETTKSNSLDKPLGLTGNRKGHLPAAASKQSRDIINAKVDAVNKALTDPALVSLLSTSGNDELINEISLLLADTSTLIAQLPEDLTDAAPEKQQNLYDNLTQLTRLIKRQLMPILNIQIGFNSTDGD